ncbi:MAG: hypothetical protein ACRC62_15545 [Microcoleus sp.]
MAEAILYYNDGGIEFWTVQATGESAMSVRGLAAMCGVTLSSNEAHPTFLEVGVSMLILSR